MGFSKLMANRAYRTDLQVGERISLALRDALFEEGRTSRTAPCSNPWRAIWAWLCLTSPISPAYWRNGTKECGVVSSARHTSSVVAPTCPALRSTSRRIPSRACRSSGTPRV